ncbi:hypothetical protein OG455_36855 [Kitasatospora sp. NBC_01287]|uniref:hypothetical protein n=1 Tax=Kitasatospora sp. NBC_01287 TaxID=2903573 RepID=UPI00224DBC2E|nr:hypothetical protein [Kitasatospora sp. NBC_01287]MCX4751014.1 hypothetical protein [Kitasatospora sp. NBC_01287]
MTGVLQFGALLTHLTGHRALHCTTLAAAAGTTPAELRAVLDGQPPAGQLLRGLGPVLGLHAADLFVLAGQPVPDDLTPVTRNPNWSVSPVVYDTMVMPAENRRPLLDAIRAQPLVAREGRGGVDRPYHRYEPGFGAVLLELTHNRNLTWPCTAQALHAVSGGRIYLSASTIGAVGRGTIEPTPELVAGFAGLLGIPAPDLAALGAIHLPNDLPPLHPRATDVAAVIWETRRLTTTQLKEVQLTSHHLANR